MPNDDAHYTIMAKHIADGDVVPFLGAGANLCDRPENASWSHGDQYLPSGAELAAFLAKTYAYPVREALLYCPDCKNQLTELTGYCARCKEKKRGIEEARDLLRVSQYVAHASGARTLYGELHKLFDADYPPTSLHTFLATLPTIVQHKGYPQTQLLVVTTNYDDLMERALQAAGHQVDVLTYEARGKHRGRFLHWPPTGRPVPIEGDANKYSGLSLDDRPVVLKIHGAVCRTDEKHDSYVIREDDYIDYLAQTSEISSVLPADILAKLRESHLLFFGYSFSDWNLRVILHRLRVWNEEEGLSQNSWAVQTGPQELDQKFWSQRRIDILDMDMNEYLRKLRPRLQEQVESLPPLGILQARSASAGTQGQHHDISG